jgi:2-oxoglutarate/2-oxoacid ferredoxin oxidoreductase subunit alpha
MTKTVEALQSVVIRFAGDSGDGMQLTGTRFTDASALFGNDVSTFPDYPAEIRAPAGTLPGVSGFQVNFSSLDIRTPGDAPDVLVAMNPAALKVNIKDLKRGGIIIVNKDTFSSSNLKKAGFQANPLEDDSLDNYRLHSIPITTLNSNAVKDIDGLNRAFINRSCNLFALGVTFWLFDRSMDSTLAWIENKFKRVPAIVAQNQKALKTGFYYAETAEMFPSQYIVEPAKIRPGTYREITGNEATAIGLVAASLLADTKLFYGSYPITPASDVLHHLSKYKNYNVITFQAEDEIAAIGVAIGASYGGLIAATGTSGPGLALKGEALGLAVMTELPLIVINVQRGGPSTGLPTKTEQSDLLQAFFGRNGECPCAIIAPKSPVDCFSAAVEAVRIAVKYMVPVIYMSDGYLANGMEPWCLPNIEDLEKIPVTHRKDPKEYYPYIRNSETLARPWAVPGTPGLEHRIGGLEKADVTGNVSYDPDNHQKMCLIRQEKVDRIAQDIDDLEVAGAEEGDVLILSWGGTYGACLTACLELHKEGHSVGHAHLRWLNPFPANLKEVLGKFKKILVPELNLGQLNLLIRSRFLIDTYSFNKVKGKPFMIAELKEKVIEVLGGEQ